MNGAATARLEIEGGTASAGARHGIAAMLEDAYRRWPLALEAALFLLALAPLLATPVLPLIDFYNHLARYFILSHIGGDTLLQSGYQAHWRLLPNIGVDVLATPLLRVVPPLIAAKLIVAAILAFLYGGALSFHRAVTGRRSLLVAILLLPLLYSYVLNWGFANFLLGLGLSFWAAGWWVGHRQRPWAAVPFACVWALGIYLAHGVAFALYGVLVISLELGYFLAGGARKVSDLARALAPVAVQAVSPILLFLVWKSGEARHLAGRASLAPDFLSLPPVVHNGLYRLGTVLRVEEGPAYWFDAATLLLQAAILFFLIRRGKIILARVAWPLLAVATVAMAVMPYRILDVFYVSDRMPLFAALCILGAIAIPSGGWGRPDRFAACLLCAIAAARIAAITISWAQQAPLYDEFRSVAAKIPAGAAVLEVMPGSGHHETNVPRCPAYGPLLVTFRLGLTPLFADPDQQPLLLAGKLRQAQDRLDRMAAFPDERLKDFNPYMTRAVKAGYRYLLVCNSHLLAKPFPPELTVREKTPHFVLLEADN